MRPTSLLRLAALALACAALPVRAEAPADRYSIGADTVLDTRTGLTWARATSPGASSWLGALSYCRGLTLGGQGGFRAPTAKELQTLVDETGVAVFADLKAFPNAAGEALWTATPAADHPAKAWAVDFRSGAASTVPTNGSLRVRCVR